jgi:hypothetical protein
MPIYKFISSSALPFWTPYTTKLSTQCYISNCWSSILQNPYGGLDALSVTSTRATVVIGVG